MPTVTQRARILVAIGGVLGALLLALLVTAYVMLQPARMTRVLRSAAQGAGLQLSLGAPAEPTLFPRPGLELHGLQLTPYGSQTPMLIAARGRIVVPWRVLLGSTPAITRLELDAPRLDLGGLQQTLAQLHGSGGNGPTLPRIDAGISIHNGALVSGNRLLFDGIELRTGTLAPGQPFNLHVAARTADGTPYTFDLAGTPTRGSGVIRFHGLHMRAQGHKLFALTLGGQGSWRGGADVELSLTGALRNAAGRTYHVDIGLQPAGDARPLTLALKVDGAHAHADLTLPPLALTEWWRRLAGADPIAGSDAPPGAPPLQGSASVQHLQAGPVSIDGLQIEAGPAAASSSAGKQP